MKVLIACECSGTVRDAFRAIGHDAISCDLKPWKRDENGKQTAQLSACALSCQKCGHHMPAWGTFESYEEAKEDAIKRWKRVAK